MGGFVTPPRCEAVSFCRHPHSQGDPSSVLLFRADSLSLHRFPINDLQIPFGIRVIEKKLVSPTTSRLECPNDAGGFRSDGHQDAGFLGTLRCLC